MDNIVSCRIQNTRDLGLVNGMGSQDKPIVMQYVRKRVLDELHYGDIVVTSGENDNYMRDIAIGTISKITTLDYNSSLNIELVPIIDFARLENVVVVNQKELNDRKADKE
jgi:rod shape-determining protein MreC